MTLSLTTKLATTTVAPTQFSPAKPQPNPKQLVAYWVRDRDNKLHCRWVKA